jgi:hypothetical protein
MSNLFNLIIISGIIRTGGKIMSTISFVTTLWKFIEARNELLYSLTARLQETTTTMTELRTLHDKAVSKFESDYTNHIEHFSSDIVEIFKREAITYVVTKISDNSFYGKVMVYLGRLLGDKTRFVRNYTHMLSEELYGISHRYTSINDILKIETINDFTNIDEYSYKFLHEYKFMNFNNFLIRYGIPPADITEHISNIHALNNDIKNCDSLIKEILCNIDKITAELKSFDMPCYYENECTILMDSAGNCSMNIK